MKSPDVQQISFWQALRRKTADIISGGYVSRLERSNTRDDLTGLFNKREYFRVLDQITGRADSARFEEAPNRPYIVVMDLDNFSAFNAIYGHDKGDDLLRIAGQYITDSFAVKDTKARFGGDEFAAICHDVTLEPPKFVTRLADIARDFDLRINEMNPDGMVRLSIGAAEFTPHTTGKQVFINADLALYHVKHDKHLLGKEGDVQIWTPGTDYARIQKAYSAFKKK